MSSINNLVDRLVEWLPGVLVDLRQQAADGTSARAPAPVAYQPPPPRSTNEVRPPCVIVRPVSGDGDDESTITVQMQVMSYSEDADGMRDDVNTIQRILNALLQEPTLGPFSLVKPVKWLCYEEQPQPIWGARITTVWTQPSCAEFATT